MKEVSHIYFLTSLLVEILVIILISNLVTIKIAKYYLSEHFDKYFKMCIGAVYIILMIFTVGIIGNYTFVICKTKIQITEKKTLIFLAVIVILNIMMLCKLFVSKLPNIIKKIIYPFPWPFNKTVGEYMLLNRSILIDSSTNEIEVNSAKLILGNKDPYNNYNIYVALKENGVEDIEEHKLFNLTYNYANYIGYCSWIFLMNISVVYYFVTLSSNNCSIT